MSVHVLTFRPDRVGGFGGPVVSRLDVGARVILRRLRDGMRHATAIRAGQRNLAVMDDRMLSDLGISRAQAAFVAGHAPWWRG
jgi:uncharacterized protein YjiS (DUF1127 family)